MTGDLILAVSFFPAPATTSIRPTRRELSWTELAKLLSVHERRDNKDGRGWSPATYAPGTTRKNSNVVAISAFVGDIDHANELVYLDIRERLTDLGLAYVLYSTYQNNPPDDYRFRVVVPFAQPVGSDDAGDVLTHWRSVWRHATDHILLGRNDVQTKDLSRFFYLPSAPPDVLVFAEGGEGEPLDWRALAPAQVATAGSRHQGKGRGMIPRIGPRTQEFIELGAAVGEQRERALGATRALLASGFSAQETADRVWQGMQASDVGDPEQPWKYEDALNLAQDLASREPTPIVEYPRLEAPVPPERKNGQAGDDGGDDDEFRPTDYGNAERLVACHGQDLRYCEPFSKWLVWDGRRFKTDVDGEVVRRAKDTIRSIYGEAAEIEDKNPRLALVGHAKRSEAQPRIRAMITLAQSESTVAVVPDRLDVDPWLLNVLNGTLDLRTGVLHAHQRDDLITKLAAVPYDPEAECPGWEAFLERILPSTGVQAFLQRALGYSLTGDTGERVVFILYGTGANGKSTFLELGRSLLGDYATATPAETFLTKREGGIPNDVARLKGARFVTAVEAEEGKRLAEALIKQAAGGADVMSARFMRAEWFDFHPEFKAWLATNHKPVIRGTDNAIWDRIRLIPFTVRIPESQQDKRFLTKLKAELPGILAWAVRGCLAWQQAGLDAPAEVQEATATYRAEMDVLAHFIEDRCVVEESAKVNPSTLFKVYGAWCEAVGEKAGSQISLGKSLEEMGYHAKRNGRERWWQGLGLLGDRE